MRTIRKAYSDPVDLIWIQAAAEMGMRVERSSEVNASWDGKGVLTIGTPETLDPDDCLAQMVLHEVCHSLCEGPESIGKPDWGLESFNPAKKVHEYACLRLQASLADQVQMRPFFAATTMFRAYYDRLPPDPLQGPEEQSLAMAKAGWQRSQEGPWSVPIREALRRTAAIAESLRGITTQASLWHHSDATDG